MLTTILRMMWRDWGFAPSLFSQAKDFLEVAQQSMGQRQEGSVRAAIIFSLMSFEAYWRDVIRGYIQKNKAKIDPRKLSKVERELSSRIGIHAALTQWPALLTGKRLDITTRPFKDFFDYKEYRNLLVHGKITDKVPGSGKLAQEVETLGDAKLAVETVAEIIKTVAAHFNFSVPTWV